MSVVASVAPSAVPAVPSVAPITPAAASVAERTVKVGVAPAGVKAEVDGKPVETRAGVIELHGGLGSTHSVLLRLGAQQLLRDVAITDDGALPDKLELGAPVAHVRPATAAAAPASKPAAAAASPAAAAPPPAAKPTAPAKPAGGSLDKNFE